MKFQFLSFKGKGENSLYKILALDMDGTLLDNNKVITPIVKKNIQELINKGKEVTLTTGRFPASVWLHGQALGLKTELIALNGSVILDQTNGEPIKTVPLSGEVAQKIAGFANKHNVYVHFHGYNVLFVENLNEMNKGWAMNNIVVDEAKERIFENYKDQLQYFEIKEVKDFQEFFKEQSETVVYKATILNENPETIEFLYQQMSNWEELSVTRTGLKRFDINATGVSKQMALKYLCDKKKIDSSEVVAIGDYDNDYKMIEWAGLGVAMGNGNTLIKSVAKVVTKSNEENGVAEIIESYF